MERRENDTERQSVKKWSWRGIKRKIDREMEKNKHGRCILPLLLVIQLYGEGQREKEPWNWCSCK